MSADQTLSDIQRLIDRDTRSAMSPGMTACITIVVVVVVAVLIALFMTQSPQGVRLLKKAAPKVGARTGRSQHRVPVRKIATAMQQRSFGPMEENEDRLSPIPGMGRPANSVVPSMLQFKQPKRAFTGMEDSDKLAPIPGMNQQGQKLQASPQPMFTSQQIKKGLNNASLYSASPQQEVTRMPRNNAWQNLWLHGDVNSQQSRAGPVVSTQSMWQELP